MKVFGHHLDVIWKQMGKRAVTMGILRRKMFADDCFFLHAVLYKNIRIVYIYSGFWDLQESPCQPETLCSKEGGCV